MIPTGRRRTDGSHILLVEDNDQLRFLMQIILEREGYSVEVARCAEDGLQAMETGRFDLLLTDLRLPGHSGAWLLREAMSRGLLSEVPALLITSDHEAPDIEAGTDIVRKPVNFDAFLPQVRAILADSQADEPAGRDAPTPRPPNQVDLVLYVSPESLPCNRAERVMHELLSQYEEHEVAFEVCDVGANPARAAADRIVFTPTLVRHTPLPRMWVVGNLSTPEAVLDLLRPCGAAPTSAR